MKTDLELRQDVERQLSWDPKLEASKIAVTAKNGVVTLTGEVRTFFDKWEAEKIVKGVLGVTGVAEDLKVNLLGTRPNDTELTERVVNSLKWNASVPNDKIKPMVSDGWVTLEGEVRWYWQKRAAESAVRYLHGVKGVTNSVTINNPVEPQDISNRITEALTRNARLDARQITVRANGHTAILDGSVRSIAERDEAESAAWSAPGVNMVEDHLSIRY